MGRELKRVPLDFNWPINQIWKGYWNPFHGMKCKTCDGSGYSPEAKKYQDDWYALDHACYRELPNGRRYNENAHRNHLTQLEVDALLAENRLTELTRDGHVPSVEEVNERSKNSAMGHDSVNLWVCTDAVMKSRGIDISCPICHGSGLLWLSEEIQKRNKDWYEKERYGPPEGEGYQLWETTTEGSPISPVFVSSEEFAEWCADNATVFGSMTNTKEQWLASFNSKPDLITYRDGNAIFI